jgi:phosphonate transport system ATP-binding protein
MASTVALRAEGVSKTFRGRRVLENVSLEIAAGELTALIGPSGSGKSTLLRGFAQLIPFDAGGRCSVFDQSLEDLARDRTRQRALRTRIGFVAQSYNLVGRLSLFANVAVGGLGTMSLPSALIGRWPQAHVARVWAAIERVGLKEFAGARASTLSGGQQQRAAVARTIAQGAQLILADEPVAALDPVSGRRVMTLLSELNAAEGVTVVVSLHHIAMAQRYCRRIVALHQGRIAYDGPADGLSHDDLRTIYGPEIDDAL